MTAALDSGIIHQLFQARCRYTHWVKSSLMGVMASTIFLFWLIVLTPSSFPVRATGTQKSPAVRMGIVVKADAQEFSSI